MFRAAQTIVPPGSRIGGPEGIRRWMGWSDPRADSPVFSMVWPFCFQQLSVSPRTSWTQLVEPNISTALGGWGMPTCKHHKNGQSNFKNQKLNQPLDNPTNCAIKLYCATPFINKLSSDTIIQTKEHNLYICSDETRTSPAKRHFANHSNLNTCHFCSRANFV